MNWIMRAIPFTVLLMPIVVLQSPNANAASSVKGCNIDSQRVIVLKQIMHQCRHQRSAAQYHYCRREHMSRSIDRGDWPGTIAYCIKQYSKLKVRELQERLSARQALQRNARYQSTALLDRHLGEMSNEDYQVEIDWLTHKLESMQTQTPQVRPDDLNRSLTPEQITALIAKNNARVGGGR